jgi:hypothetical protein
MTVKREKASRYENKGRVLQKRIVRVGGFLQQNFINKIK